MEEPGGGSGTPTTSGGSSCAESEMLTRDVINNEPAIVTEELPPEVAFDLIMGWKGQKFELRVMESDTVGDLKVLIWTLTSVPLERQKLLGLVKGKLPGDEQEVVTLGLKEHGKPKEFMMIGTPEGEEHQEIGPIGPLLDDRDVDYSNQKEAAKLALAHQAVRNRRKLKETAEALTIDLMSPPRPGKKLLVLDLDYCILDTGLWKEANFVAEHFARPHLHSFLGAVSPYYDIVIWSQTSWRYLEQKLLELDIIGDNKRGDYNICFVLDRQPMFSVYSERNGKPFKHEVKALGIIWHKFPQFSEANTIHVDDLSRNFAMNPKNGLRVHAYKDSMATAATDHELLYVTKYLLQLSLVPDFSSMDHKRFKKLDAPLPEGVEDPVETERQRQGS